MRPPFYSPYIGGRGFGRGMGAAGDDLFSQAWAAISNASNSGAASTGDIASWLLAAGYSAATISGILNNVSQVADVTPAMIAAAQQEQAWLTQYNQRTNWVPILLIGGLLLWTVSRGKN